MLQEHIHNRSGLMLLLLRGVPFSFGPGSAVRFDEPEPDPERVSGCAGKLGR